MPPKSVVRRFGRNKTVVDVNNIPNLLRALPLIREGAVQVGATQMHNEMQQYAHNNEWVPNAPETVDWKGHSDPMIGRTGALLSNIEVRSSTDEMPAPAPSLGAQRLVGWFDGEHPDPSFAGRTFTFAELAWIHELGVEKGGNVGLPGDTGGSYWEIPPRPWASSVADMKADDVLLGMALAALEGIFAFNNIHITRASGKYDGRTKTMKLNLTGRRF